MNLGLKTHLSRRYHAGLTLVEVVVSVSIAAVAFSGVLLGYVQTGDQAEWSSYSLAAQSLAVQGIEQARGAKWDPAAWPPVDEMGLTNITSVDILDVPVAGKPLYATTYLSVTEVTANPPVRQMRADCVWSMPGRKAGNRGPFTNTVVTLRACDQ